MKTAIVIDLLVQKGGAEYLLKVISEIFPEAPIYTLLYLPDKTYDYFREKKIIQAKLTDNKIIGGLYKKKYKYFLGFYPYLIEDFDFSKYDVVISLSFLLAKNIIVPTGTKHICYCLTPARHFWEMPNEYLGFIKNRFSRILTSVILHKLRLWDEISSGRPDEYIAISDCVRKRLKKRYRCEAEVIYPPYDDKIYGFDPEIKKEDYYLMVSRLVPYKKIDYAIRAFNENKKKLVIAGTGEEYAKLKKIAKENITFTGYISDDELKLLYQKARALIFPGEEDFGISILNSLASGTPVIAYNRGGAKELLRENKNGLFFNDNNSTASLDKAINEFENKFFSSVLISNNIKEFSETEFKKRFKNYKQFV